MSIVFKGDLIDFWTIKILKAGYFQARDMGTGVSAELGSVKCRVFTAGKSFGRSRGKPPDM